jgi:outer membrane protein assembly factor BamB
MRAIGLLAVAVLTASAIAGEWPNFQGPTRTGVAQNETKLAKSWPEDGPKQLWTFKLGKGFAGPAISGGKVYVLDRVGDKQDVLRCVDLVGGEQKWEASYDVPGTLDHNGSRATPSLDDKYAFAIGPFGDVYCVGLDGKKVWTKNLAKDFGSKLPKWGFSQSPLIYGDWVIIAPCSDTAGVVALKKSDGSVVWKSEPIGSTQYNSPQLVTIDKVEQIVMYGGTKPVTVTGLSPKDGSTLWKYTGFSCSIPIPSVVPAGDGKFFMSGGYGAGSQLFEVKRGADGKWSAAQLWKLSSKQCGSQIQDALLVDGHLYVDNNENGKNLGMTCVDLSGTVKWTSNDPKLERGGQILADGMMYKSDGCNGWVYLIKPSPEKLDVVSKAKVLSPGENWAPLAISDGKLIVRDQGKMVCLDVSGG